MASVANLLETRLKLRVNREKSAVAYVEERKFLGHRLLRGGKLGIAPKSVERATKRIREITRRNRGVRFDRMLSELRSFLTGWVTYLRDVQCKTLLKALDEWVWHKARCYRLKQCKRAIAIRDFLRSCGVPNKRAWLVALLGKGRWRLASTPGAHEAMSQKWLTEQGLVSLHHQYQRLNR